MSNLLRAWRQVLAISYRAWPAGSALMTPAFVAHDVVRRPLLAFALRGAVDGFGTTAGMWWAVAAVVGIGASQWLAVLVNHVQEVLYLRVPQEVARRLMRVSLEQPGIEHLERPDFADRLETVRTRTASVTNAFANLGSLISDVAATAISIVALAAVHPLLALPIAALAPALWLQTWAIRRELRAIDEVVPEQRLARHLARSFLEPGPAKEVRAFDLRDILIDRHKTLSDTAISKVARARRSHVAAGASAGVVKALALAAGMAGIVLLARAGETSAGNLVLAVVLLRAVIERGYDVIDMVARTVETGMTAQRYLWLLDYRSPITSGSRTAPTQLHRGIRLQDVSFTYPGTANRVLDNVNLEIPAGKVVALVGDNGAGKTTLVKLLLRLYDPTAGRILLDDVDLRDLDLHAWRGRTSAAFQDFARLHVPLQDAIAVGDLTRRDRVTDAAEMAGASFELPDGLQTLLGRELSGGVELSEGQWQRVALARALMRDAPLLLLLDEPTASLDPRAEHELFERFATASAEARRRGAVTLLVSHRFSTVRAADLIVVLNEGRVVEQGTHDELIANRSLYAELYTLQARAYLNNRGPEDTT